MGKYPHRPGYLLPILLTVVVLAVTFTFNGLAASGPNAIFENATGAVSDAYYLEITPAGWTFSIWGFIYAWQVLWLAYGLSTICRGGIDGYLYYSPVIMPPALYVIYMVNLCLNVTWLVLWDREEMPAALAVLALIPTTLVLCLVLSYRAVLVSTPALVRYSLTKEIWWIRWTVQNGLAFYCTWTSIATLLNLGVVLAYWGDMAQSDASTVCLGVLGGELLLWLILDLCVLDQYGVRYTFSPYIVVVFALTGSIAKNYGESSTVNTVLSFVLLGVGAVGLVVKIVVMLYRHNTDKIGTFQSTLDDVNKVDRINMDSTKNNAY